MIKPLRPWIDKLLVWQDWSWPLAVTVLILGLAALIPISWFEPDRIIFKGDPVMTLDPARSFIERWSLWPAKNNLGYEPSITIASVIHQFIQAIPVWLGGDDRLSEMWHFSFWFVLPGLTMAVFIRALADRLAISRWAVPVAVIFYLFNLYRLALFGDNNHFEVYAAVPLLFYWVTIAIRPKSDWRRPAIGFGLSTLLAAQAGTNPPQYLMIWLAVGIYGSILTLADRHNWRSALNFWLLALATTVIVNLFWVLPFALTLLRQSGLSSGANLDWLSDLSKHTSLPRVLRLIGAWGWFDNWRGEPYAPYAAIYQQPFWWQLAIIPAAFSLLFLAFRRAWNRYSLALLVIGCLAIIFSQGTHPPSGRLFEWAAKNLPFFWIFRSPWYKFTNLTAFSYAALIGLGIGYLMTYLSSLRSTGWRFWLAPIILVVVMALPPVLAHPLVTGRLWTTEQEVSNLSPDIIPYPTHIRRAADWLNSQPGNTAVALLPYQGASIYSWGYSSLIDPIVYFSRRPIFTRGDRIGYVPGETMGATTAYRVFVDRLYNGDPAAINVARLLGIEFIVERKDIKYEFYDDTDSPEFVTKRLSSLPDVVYERSFDDWDIYRVRPAPSNPAFASTHLIQFDGHPLDRLSDFLSLSLKNEGQWPAVIFSRPIKQPRPSLVETIVKKVSKDAPPPLIDIKRSSTNYTITGSSREPFVLVLNQSFDPLWQATSHNSAVTGPIVVNGYAPAWLVESSGQFIVQINYRPQRLVVPLTLISGLSAGLAIVLLWFPQWLPKAFVDLLLRPKYGSL